MLPWRTADPKQATSQEETNDRARVKHSSTNSSFVDIELGITLPPRPPPRSRLATFRAAASTLTAPFSARAATSTGGSQAASGQATAPQRRRPWYRRLSSCDELDSFTIIMLAMFCNLVLFVIFGFGYLIYTWKKNGTGDLSGVW